MMTVARASVSRPEENQPISWALSTPQASTTPAAVSLTCGARDLIFIC